MILSRRAAVRIRHGALSAEDSFLRRLRKGARAAAAPKHHQVLGVCDWGHDEVPYLVSQYLGGGSLQSIIAAGKLLTFSQGLLVGLEANWHLV